MTRTSSSSRAPDVERRLPVGAEPQAAGGVHFRIWAPKHRRVDVALEDEGGRSLGVFALAAEPKGWFSGLVKGAATGSRYRYRLGGAEQGLPDPASRWQPEGPHGPSVVVDPAAFRWSDAAWRGRGVADAVLYELHIGAFTPEGTWAAAAARLPALAELGITTLEVMPVNEFAGQFGWGYDGVNLFAPTRNYGTPDEMRAFVDRAHALGLAVVLDVVYNHLGPDGNYMHEYAEAFFSRRHASEWGDTPNFDDAGSPAVRAFVCANVHHWIAEYHLDGLRLDATQAIHDDSPPAKHILTEIGAAVREAAAGRATFVVNENEPQRACLVRPPERGGHGLDAIWNDDWHHSAMVALLGRDEAYYTDYRGAAQEFLSAAKFGFLYQGQWYRWQRDRRGTPSLDVPAERFVHFLQNHDQVANSGAGDRCHRLANASRWRAMTALLLLGPQTPMLFMGQEFGSSSPFLYFADHKPELAALVAKGRRENLAQFPTLALPEMQPRLAVPHDPATFARCKLDWREWDAHAPFVRLHRDLLRLRREEPALRRRARGDFDGAVLTDECFVLRWFTPDDTDRLLVVNLGRTLHFDPAPEPLLAPVDGRRWAIRWSSEHPDYGGLGTPVLDAPEADRTVPGRPHAPSPLENWRIPADSAVLLAPA